MTIDFAGWRPLLQHFINRGSLLIKLTVPPSFNVSNRLILKQKPMLCKYDKEKCVSRLLFRQLKYLEAEVKFMLYCLYFGTVCFFTLYVVGCEDCVVCCHFTPLLYLEVTTCLPVQISVYTVYSFVYIYLYIFITTILSRFHTCLNSIIFLLVYISIYMLFNILIFYFIYCILFSYLNFCTILYLMS